MESPAGLDALLARWSLAVYQGIAAVRWWREGDSLRSPAAT